MERKKLFIERPYTKFPQHIEKQVIPLHRNEESNGLMDKSGIFVGATVGSISVLIIFTALFIIPAESDETTIQMQDQINENELQMQDQINEINNIILTRIKNTVIN